MEKHVGLAYHYARRFTPTGMEYEDLVQEGLIGLMEAAERFDPNRGVRFSTYAIWHIRKSMLEALRSRNDVVRTPRRKPSVACTGLENAADMIDPDPLAHDILQEIEEDDIFNGALRQCIKKIPQREGIVIRLRHGIDCPPHTLRQVGGILGVSPERVRQIQAVAEEKLRHVLLDCATLGENGAIMAERQEESAEPANE